ncbi:MAG TPA: toll/interleukin-1 receptor domain-containing protein, partial [Longimicrobium sp.]|nr:toll/interleukin-1 receptor domain-containing protein [Longimicrobium sp.]
MKYDVFISYAHVDDAPLVKGEPGWVTTLVTTLRMLLAQKLPRRDDQPAKAEVWMDPRLRGHGDLDVEIAQALEQSATLLIVLSSAYVNAPYCALEFKTFLRLAGERALDRVFVVEYDQARRPEELRPLRGYSFWSADALAGTSRPIAFPLPDADEVDYYARLWDLSAQMAAQVQRMRAAEAAEPELAPALEGVEPSGRPVYLADTTDDLDADRDRIRRYLNQAGFRVVPEGWYPRDDPERYAAAAARDMAEARLFVQLLGPVPGRRPPTLPEGYAALQCRLAEAARLEVVQWRPRDLDPGTVADPHLRTLLERPTVQ